MYNNQYVMEFEMYVLKHFDSVKVFGHISNWHKIRQSHWASG